jgi:hypothetical protein
MQILPCYILKTPKLVQTLDSETGNEVDFIQVSHK